MKTNCNYRKTSETAFGIVGGSCETAASLGFSQAIVRVESLQTVHGELQQLVAEAGNSSGAQRELPSNASN
jgi:hypothetical protein